MYEKYSDQLQILAFPCNQFLNQEPCSNEDVHAFITGTYNAKYPIFGKIEVNGPNAHEVYKYLRANSQLYSEKDKEADVIPWNFAKFLVDAEGRVKHYWAP